MASLLDIAPPGQGWKPGQPVDYAALNRAGDRWNAGQTFWNMPPLRPGDNPFGAQYAVPKPGFGTPGSPAGQTGASTPSPFTAETLVKNPELAAILKKLYGDIGNLSLDPTKNQTVLQRNVKLPEVEAAGQAALATQQADANNNAQSIADFTKSFMAAQPAAEATTAEETRAIGRLYSGEYAKELEDNRRKTGILTTQNLLRRIGMIGGTGNAGELGRGGVTNSITNANLMREVANASLARDLEFQGQERTDIGDIQSRQSGNAGLRQKLIDAVLQRALVPIQAGQNVAGNDVNRLGAISSLLTGNSLFTPQSQAGMIQQLQQLLGGQAGLDSAANWRYTRGDFPNQMPGVVRQGGLSLPNIDTGGGGGDIEAMLRQILSEQGGQPMLPPGPSATGSLPNITRTPNFSTWDDYMNAQSGGLDSQGDFSTMADYYAALNAANN